MHQAVALWPKAAQQAAVAAQKARCQIVAAHMAAQATSRDTPVKMEGMVHSHSLYLKRLQVSVCERPRAPSRQKQGGMRSAKIQALHQQNHRKPQSLCALGAEAEGAGCAT